LSEATCLRGIIAEAVQDVDVAAFKVETETEVIDYCGEDETLNGRI
jgi:hypothetical protein